MDDLGSKTALPSARQSARNCALHQGSDGGTAVPRNLSRWIIGFVAGVCALGALFMAAGAEERIMHYTAIVFFIAAVLFLFGLIKQSFDEAQRH
ncbi:MAG: hypothetical protein MUE49_01765 [Rhodospirillales bacterium]|nr:hypothetical protein [Rhodospirillales bacterium]